MKEKTPRDRAVKKTKPKKTYVMGYKTKKGTRNFTPKQSSVIAQVENGTDIKIALKTAGYSDKSIVPLSYKFRNYLLTQPRRFKKLATAVDKIVSDFMGGEKDFAGNVERLYIRGLDQITPKITVSENVNKNFNFSVVKMEKYS